MAWISVSTQIDASPECVFQIATDLEKFPERIKEIKKIEVLTPRPVGVGTRFKETRVMFGKEATEEMEFTAFEPGRSYTLGCQSCGCVYTSQFRFEPKDGGTLLTLDFSTRATSFLAKLFTPLGWLMKGMLRRCLEGDLKGVKAAAEAMAKQTVEAGR